MQDTSASGTREFSAWKSSKRLDHVVLRYVVVAVVVASLTFLAAMQMQRMNGEARRVQDLRRSVAAALALEIDEETGLRGFIATNHQLFLQPYYKAGPKLAALKRFIPSQLAALNIDDARRPFADFVRTHDVWHARVADPVLTGWRAARNVQRQEFGKALVDRMRRDIAQTDAAISITGDRILDRARELAIVGSVLAALWVLGVGVIAIVTDRRRAASESALFLSVLSGRQSALRLSEWRSKIIAMLAHDFKAQLGVILSYTDLLEDFPDRRDDRNVYENMRRATRRLTEMTDETLLLARITSDTLRVSKKPVAIDELIEEAVQGYRKERTMLVHCRRNLRVLGDAPYLARILHNLLSNALKYSPSQMPVDVVVSKRANWVEIAVHDRGCGIGREELPHVFEEYWRSPNASQEAGTGIGLFIVRKIVEAHGGTVTIESRESRGTTVYVKLAAAE